MAPPAAMECPVMKLNVYVTLFAFPVELDAVARRD
jgi:hypothetical protein